MNYTPSELDGIRERLLEEQRSTLALVTGLGTDIRLIVEARQDANSDDEHDPEGSTLAFERSQSDALLRQAAERLDAIAAALGRLDEGRYGLCQRCGDPISPGRLDARPSASTCIHCAV